MGHYKNKQRNTTRSSNTSQSSQNTTSTSTSTTVSNDDDFSVGIKVKSSRNTTPKNNNNKKDSPVVSNPEPEPEAEKPRLPEWEEMGMTEEDYWAMRQRTAEQMRAYQLENYRNNMLKEYDSISYWKERLERFEKMREPYNKTRGWSALTVSSVEYIDKEIEECKNKIDYLESYSEEE